MKILSIDTSSKICSVAVLEDKDVIIEKHIDDELTHSQKLMPMVEDVLKSCNLKISDFDLYACSIGPGSFTGVRIGVSTIKAFTDVTNVTPIGISSLEGLAYNTLENNIHDTTDIVCSLIDAKNDNVYCGIYEKETDGFKQLEDLCAKNIDDVLNLLKKYASSSILFVGDGAIVHKYKILQELSETTFVEKELNNQSAVSIGKAAYDKYKKTDKTNDLNSNTLNPLYLRKSQAERALEGEK